MPEKSRTSAADLFARIESEPEVYAEKAAIDLMEQARLILDTNKIPKKELAKRMGVSESYVSRTLKRPPNMTLSTFFRLAKALGTIEYASVTLDKRYLTVTGGKA